MYIFPVRLEAFVKDYSYFFDSMRFWPVSWKTGQKQEIRIILPGVLPFAPPKLPGTKQQE